MEIMTDERGDICLAPDDYVYLFGMSILEWFGKKGDCSDTGSLAEFATFITRCEQVSKAWNLIPDYLKKDHFRHEPRVLENYTPTGDSQGVVTRFFIFKFDNNGSTVKIMF